MLVSSSSCSKSRSLRLVPPTLAAMEMSDSAGDAAPDLSIRDPAGAADCDLAVDGRTIGGRILCFREGATAAGRVNPAIQKNDVAVFD